MTSLLVHDDRKLPNPFCEGDKARDTLEQCQRDIQELKHSNGVLMECVGLLMRIQTEKEKKDAAPKI